MAKIFITGITGFLGSNIAEYLINEEHDVTAIYRPSSSRERCNQYYSSVNWILQDDLGDWQDAVIKSSPDVIVHSAWLGVGHLERDDWNIQVANIDFLKSLLFIASKSEASKFISLGSQAEYGIFEGTIDEEYPTSPTEAYGCVKVVCSELVKQFCNYHKIDWFWLRLFSFFGKGEADNWLIPSMVKRMFTGTEMDFTAGEQKYSYLYVSDLALAVNNITTKNGVSGIYNISGKNVLKLKTLITDIRDHINPSFQLNFGNLPYRKNQPMHMQGNSSKFVKEFGEFDVTDFKSAMLNVLDDLKQKITHNNEGI
ncbi:NAD(P)-dependent oxidoreductase [Mucilaginibacter pallidiroseus]|uniref:NAD(P)-dependent oxidoreductase n=1 Tax=Mucilaginibacter pallidiroseus TaxID=2599295 RepID=A0A563UID7_9SPHI|nr:NAD(P)-dependent oxidoreductase [Mucilaginibacter pallidiroseus]TWR31170.1 NAD(P)-dependent oxidoreductase [Mucilaginibacter pallidiroseus]